jgi:AcrR family transcriptional regulator
MLTAMVDVVAERGAANVTVAHVVARSGVSRRTFYEIFEDREDCLLAAFDEALGRAAARVRPVYEAPGRWRERIRAALTALVAFFDEEPAMARLLVVESLAAGATALQRRSSALTQVVGAIERGREEAKAEVVLPLVIAEGLVGAVLSVIHGRLVASPPLSTTRGPRIGDPEGDLLLGLVNPLMSMIVLPYLGSAAARRELQQPVPKMSLEHRNGRRDPLQDLEMRLTYRTVRVLLVVAANPGSSNRRVADTAGITDQGQISKLLTRLRGLGLIENSGAGASRGEPNAWALTARGREVHDAIDTQTSS